MSFMRKVFYAELPSVPEKFRPLFTLYVAGFCVFYAVTFISSLHFVFLGPGLGDDFTFDHVAGIFSDAYRHSQETGYFGWLAALTALFVFSTTYRAWIAFKSYKNYPKALGRPMPLDDILLFGLTNLLNVLFAPLLLLLLAVAASLLGYPPEMGLQALRELAQAAHALAMQVPTVVNLPNWVAFFCSIMVGSFVHYWMHRWSHTRRFLWLVLHRPHHMPSSLAQVTVFPVVMSFPLFLLLAFPYIFVFAAIGKLFHEQPLYFEMVMFQAVIMIGEIYGHAPAVYADGIRQKWVRALSFFYSMGVYHVLHHAATPDSGRKTNNNTVNLGPGLFCCWDILFGTYQPLPDKVPEIGLFGNPALARNPLRLLLAGIVQIIDELRSNKDFGTRMKILFGPSDYTPPVSRDFLLRA